MELHELQPGDLADVPFWPGRVTVEDVIPVTRRLARVHWTSSHGEGHTTVSLAAQVNRAPQVTSHEREPHMTGNTIRAHKAGGSENLTEDQALAYLTADGYGTETEALMADARRFPCGYKYTADRHRYIVFIMPGAYWLAGDCAESEERIKALGARRRGEI